MHLKALARLASLGVGLLAGTLAAQNRMYIYHVDCAPTLSFVCDGYSIISAIDLSTNKVVATIPFDVKARLEFAATPDGKRVYMTNKNIWVMETATNRIIAAIEHADTRRGYCDGPGRPEGLLRQWQQ